MNVYIHYSGEENFHRKNCLLACLFACTFVSSIFSMWLCDCIRILLYDSTLLTTTITIIIIRKPSDSCEFMWATPKILFFFLFFFSLFIFAFVCAVWDIYYNFITIGTSACSATKMGFFLATSWRLNGSKIVYMRLLMMMVTCVYIHLYYGEKKIENEMAHGH